MNATTLGLDSITRAGTELARYRVSSGERILMGWRRPGGMEITDRPLRGRARGYLVDRGFTSGEQLAAFVGEYVGQATRLDACPMSAAALAAILANSESDAVEALISRGVLG